MNDLVGFIEARLDEDERIARRCDGADECGQWTATGKVVDFCQVEMEGFHPAYAEHIARHDPARVLREVQAKRRVLARHCLSPAEGDPERPWDDYDDCQYDGDEWPCPDLLTLAMAYDWHPDYDEAWRL